jgi:hypothetical protein
MIKLYFFVVLLGTLAAAQQLCSNFGYEVVETLVIIELPSLNGRKKLSKAGNLTALVQFTDTDFETFGSNPDRVHKPRDA